MSVAQRHGLDSQRVRHAWLSVLLGAALAVGIFAGPWRSRVRAETDAREADARLSAPERAPAALFGVRAGDPTLAIERRSKTGGNDPVDRPDIGGFGQTPRRASEDRVRVEAWALPRVATLGPSRTRAPPHRAV